MTWEPVRRSRSDEVVEAGRDVDRGQGVLGDQGTRACRAG